MGQPAAGPARQHPEAVAQHAGDLLNGQHPHSGSRQLDGQWNSVQLATYARHRLSIFIAQGKARMHSSSSFQEQTTGVASGYFCGGFSDSWLGQRHRRYGPIRLPGQAQRLPTGRNHDSVGAATQQRFSKFRCSLGHVLTVV